MKVRLLDSFCPGDPLPRIPVATFNGESHLPDIGHQAASVASDGVKGIGLTPHGPEGSGAVVACVSADALYVCREIT